ncbi:MAG: hypothetical protein A2X12_08375 [Bacteroidetes bacterium GWE2_29_8]|nr:MAG: hypothetical protein A2X12_08375 [Bacteroidetes bacterium GWE2_29_8]OFY19152.1 MAG: hypothetical protein A2X02_00485 [Bacteroidetes bacterium GWF2_29_10]
MFVKELNIKEFITLKTSDTGLYALDCMTENKVSHLPIVNNEELLGLISEDDIHNFNQPQEALGNHVLSLIKPYVLENQHVYDVIKIFGEHKLTLLPVLDKTKKYLGVLTASDLLYNLSKFASYNEPGAIIILELNSNDYSLSEISQIIESNDAKVLSLYLTSFKDSTKIDVTIKINKQDISSIMQTFNRYDYKIKGTFTEDDFYDDLVDRYNSLMNYLNV